MVDQMQCELLGRSIAVIDMLRQSEAADAVDTAMMSSHMWVMDELQRRWRSVTFAVKSALADALQQSLTDNENRIRQAVERERLVRKTVQWWYTKKDRPKTILWSPLSMTLPAAYMLSPWPVRPSWLRSGPVPVLQWCDGIVVVRPRVMKAVAMLLPKTSGVPCQLSTLEQPLLLRAAVVYYLFPEGRETLIGAETTLLPGLFVNPFDVSRPYWQGVDLGIRPSDVVTYWHPNGTVFRDTRPTVLRRGDSLMVLGQHSGDLLPDWSRTEVYEVDDEAYVIFPDLVSLDCLAGRAFADGHYVALQYIGRAGRPVQ
jgi:uncharacterized membrane protein YkvA (DUF1232 family)